MKKNVLLGLMLAVVVAGLGILISGESIRFGEGVGSLKGMNARTMALIALPFIFIIYFIVSYLRKKNEGRKWKQAILRTRSKKR